VGEPRRLGGNDQRECGSNRERRGRRLHPFRDRLRSRTKFFEEEDVWRVPGLTSRLAVKKEIKGGRSQHRSEPEREREGGEAIGKKPPAML